MKKKTKSEKVKYQEVLDRLDKLPTISDLDEQLSLLWNKHKIEPKAIWLSPTGYQLFDKMYAKRKKK